MRRSRNQQWITPTRMALTVVLSFLFIVTLVVHAQVPALLNYQGKIAADGLAFNGVGQFKLALINLDASEIYWLNATDDDNDGTPDASLSVTVSQGLYSILLGDTQIPNMASIDPAVFSNSEVYLRIWFNDGINGLQQLSPDQRVVSVGYALVGGTVPDRSISQQKLTTDLADTIADLTSQVADLSTQIQQLEGPNSASGATLVSQNPLDSDLLDQGYQPFYSLSEQPWNTPTALDSPSPRTDHSAVWTGRDMLIWGGYLGNGSYTQSGGAYSPSADHWTTTTTFNAPSARQSHAAIWTGNEMIVWGGFNSSGYLNSGARYQPDTQSWTGLPTSDSPSNRSHHSMVWTGNVTVVFGGRNSNGFLGDGAIYNPISNQWTALSAPNPPLARHSASALWTTSELIVWGGETGTGPTNTGSRLGIDASGAPQQWSEMTLQEAPSARVGHAAVWTGSKFLVWGGRNGTTFFQDGAIYDPTQDTWSTISNTDAPDARAGHIAVWTGSELLIYGGEDATVTFSSGAAFDPLTQKWRKLTTSGSPIARSHAAGIWTNQTLITFGGHAQGVPLASLQRLNPVPAWHFYRKL